MWDHASNHLTSSLESFHVKQQTDYGETLRPSNTLSSEHRESEHTRSIKRRLC